MPRLATFLALLPLSLPVFADQLSACLEETGGAPAAIIGCLDAERSRQDARLNAAYQKVLGRAEGEQESRLRDSQRHWTKYRDASCDFVGSLTGGALDSIRYLECLVRETSHRANELEATQELLRAPANGAHGGDGRGEDPTATSAFLLPRHAMHHP